jgi:hypothetical protein
MTTKPFAENDTVLVRARVRETFAEEAYGHEGADRKPVGRPQRDRAGREAKHVSQPPPHVAAA